MRRPFRELVTLLAEEVDGMAGELSARVESLDAELADIEDRLERLYEALESRLYTLESLQPRIMKLRARQESTQRGKARCHVPAGTATC